jgi:hypothetical protein
VGVVAPDLLAGAGIDGEGDTPVGLSVNDSVGEKRCGFLLATTLPDLVLPGETQTLDVCRRDLRERTVTLFGPTLAIGQPFATFGLRFSTRYRQLYGFATRGTSRSSK